MATIILAVSLMQAHEKAAAACEQDKVVTSYTVIRLVFNSLDEPPVSRYFRGHTEHGKFGPPAIANFCGCVRGGWYGHD